MSTQPKKPRFNNYVCIFGFCSRYCFGIFNIICSFFFWPHATPRLSWNELASQYPDKKWVSYIHFGLPIFWLLLYMALFPLFWNISDKNLYLVTFPIGGGWAIGHGILEILTTVSMKNIYRFSPETYVVDKSIRRLGWLRIGSVIILGIIPFVVLELLS